MIALTTIMIACFGLTHRSARAQDKTLSPYFFINSDNPSIDKLPLKSTAADVNIAGVIANVSISQVYVNEGKQAIEAVYTFPTSTRAAVHGMKMIIGSRVIEAEIKEKDKARKTYEKAKEQGKRTSLLEQERPNVFTMNVANIMPGDRVEVVLEYTELLIPTDGQYDFIFPTVVGPRYSNESTATASVDNQFVATPYLKSGIDPTFSFDMHVQLSTGVPLQKVNCTSHQINVAYPNLNKAVIQLNDSEKKGGNRDFILSYQLKGNQIESGLMLYEGKDENFFTLMIQPPKTVTNDHIPPREYIFVVDVSGSMNGFPLDVSKTLLRNLISNLRNIDRFNVILFAGGAYQMAETSINANEKNIRLAIDVIDQQIGGGSTELLPALRKALDLPRCEVELSRSIVVVTDGYINVERAAFDLIQNNLNQANLFAFGIGSGVNRHLIEGMAHVGMGEPFVITSQNGAYDEAEKFRQYIQSPVLTQITANFGDFEVYDVQPNSIPDVLAERPVMIYGKWKGKPKGEIKVKGYTNGQPYYQNFTVQDVLPDPSNEGLKYVWARETIKLLDDYKQVEYNNDRHKTEVTKLGLKYNLMTAYTSFVAVDKEVANNGELVTKVDQPLPLPQNVSNSAVGFDMEIYGVVRSKKTTTKQMISVGDIECSLAEAEMLIIKNTIANLLSTEIAKNSFQYAKNNFNIELTIDEMGIVTEFRIIDGEANEDFLNHLEFILIGWQIEDLNPTNKIKLIIPLMVF